jgi:predicted DNA-binding transcriptional regulator AlpA
MPSAPIQEPMISVQLPAKNSRRTVRPQQPIAKKMPHSQKPSAASSNGTSDTLDDVSFLRLPEVKAVTGLSKTSIYELIREKCAHRDRLLNAVGRFPAIRSYFWTRKSIGVNADSVLPAFRKLRI